MPAKATQDPIRLKLENPGGRPPFLEFINACNALRSCLKNVERCLFGNEEDSEYEIADLRYASAEIAVKGRNGSNRYPEVHRVTWGTIEGLQTGQQVDSRLDYAALRSFQEFSSPVKRRLQVSLNGVLLTLAYVQALDRMLEPIHKSRGSVTGRLEAINVHDHTRFTLYTSRDGEEVTCNFNNNALLPKVLAAVEKRQRVIVYGLLRFTRGRSYPTSVEVDDFDPLPDARDIPSLLDMRGTLPPEMPSSESVRALRNEWE